MDAIMSSIQGIKGTTYWYSTSSSGSLESLREDLGNTVITGSGNISHGIIPNSIPILSTTGNTTPSSNQLTSLASTTGLANGDYIFGVGIPAKTVIQSISGSTVTMSQNATATGTGDYIKLASDTDAGYYKIQSVDSLTQVTLVNNFSGTSTGPAGAIAAYAFGSYAASPSPRSVPEVQLITVGSEATITQNSYFFLNSSGNARLYYVWFNLNGTGTDPMPAYTNASVEVNLTTGMTSTQVAAALTAALNSTFNGDFIAVQQPTPNEVLVTNSSAGVTEAGSNFDVLLPLLLLSLRLELV
ncbi:unnamed protein product [Sphagnum jensenii]|uniref:Uncharacterized protein n=1 Tax=Sphagnum jensenii TaxID=128206 RepID=A0ABP0VFA4_9BRYO